MRVSIKIACTNFEYPSMDIDFDTKKSIQDLKNEIQKQEGFWLDNTFIASEILKNSIIAINEIE
jgi:hypothetical protein